MSQSNKPEESFEFTLVSTAEPSTVEVDGYNVIGTASDTVEQMSDTNAQDEETEELLEKRLARASGIGSAVFGFLVARASCRFFWWLYGCDRFFLFGNDQRFRLGDRALGFLDFNLRYFGAHDSAGEGR